MLLVVTVMVIRQDTDVTIQTANRKSYMPVESSHFS